MSVTHTSTINTAAIEKGDDMESEFIDVGYNSLVDLRNRRRRALQDEPKKQIVIDALWEWLREQTKEFRRAVNLAFYKDNSDYVQSHKAIRFHSELTYEQMTELDKKIREFVPAALPTPDNTAKKTELLEMLTQVNKLRQSLIRQLNELGENLPEEDVRLPLMMDPFVDYTLGEV